MTFDDLTALLRGCESTGNERIGKKGAPAQKKLLTVNTDGILDAGKNVPEHHPRQ